MSKLTLSFKGTVLRIYPVLKGNMLIGSDAECQIHIDSLAIEPQHARLDSQGETSVLVDLDTEVGTFVNNQRIEKQMLKDGDVIRIGKHHLTYHYESVPELAETPAPEFNPMEMDWTAEAAKATGGENTKTVPPEKTNQEGKRLAWLQIMNGQNLGKTISLNRSMTNLGKPGIATAIISRRNEGYFLSHLEGEESPRVDDKLIGTQSYKLVDGDTIQIGNIKMQFFLD